MPSCLSGDPCCTRFRRTRRPSSRSSFSIVLVPGYLPSSLVYKLDVRIHRELLRNRPDDPLGSWRRRIVQVTGGWSRCVSTRGGAQRTACDAAAPVGSTGFAGGSGRPSSHENE